MTESLTSNNRKTGGQFAVKRGGHFPLKQRGHFKMKQGGQLDWNVQQGLRYVRYADDFSVYTKTKAEARKVGNNIYLFLKDKLKLPINREKSGLRKPVHF